MVLSIGTVSVKPFTVGGGAGSSRVTLRVTVVLFPTESVAMTAIAFAPVARATGVVNAPALDSVAAAPFTVTRTADWSVAEPVTVMFASGVVSPSAGALTTSTGAVVSSVTLRTTVVAFPAASVATSVIVFSPSDSAIVL